MFECGFVHECIYCLQNPGGVSDSLQQELKVAVKALGLGQVLCKSSMCSYLLSHFSRFLSPSLVCLSLLSSSFRGQMVPYSTEGLPSTVGQPWHCHYYMLRETDTEKTAFPLNPKITTHSAELHTRNRLTCRRISMRGHRLPQECYPRLSKPPKMQLGKCSMRQKRQIFHNLREKVNPVCSLVSQWFPGRNVLIGEVGKRRHPTHLHAQTAVTLKAQWQETVRYTS